MHAISLLALLEKMAAALPMVIIIMTMIFDIHCNALRADRVKGTEVVEQYIVVDDDGNI